VNLAGHARWLRPRFRHCPPTFVARMCLQRHKTVSAPAFQEHFAHRLQTRGQLMTMAYADRALGDFVRKSASSRRQTKRSSRFSGPSDGRSPPLETPKRQMQRRRSRIYWQAAFIASSKYPRVEEALRPLRVLASTLAVSINDVPCQWLACWLSARHCSISRRSRCHALGGATSSHYSAPAPRPARDHCTDVGDRRILASLRRPC
jgi:hypothetical protein